MPGSGLRSRPASAWARARLRPLPDAQTRHLRDAAFQTGGVPGLRGSLERRRGGAAFGSRAQPEAQRPSPRPGRVPAPAASFPGPARPCRFPWRAYPGALISGRGAESAQSLGELFQPDPERSLAGLGLAVAALQAFLHGHEVRAFAGRGKELGHARVRTVPCPAGKWASSGRPRGRPRTRRFPGPRDRAAGPRGYHRGPCSGRACGNIRVLRLPAA